MMGPLEMSGKKPVSYTHLDVYKRQVFAPWPLLSLAGCALCGFSVGILWPGTFSLSMVHCPEGGTAMFALFALAGDVGCALRCV